MAGPGLHAAIDLGAGGGRVLVGSIRADRVDLHEVHRFTYPPRRVDGHLRWDFSQLFKGLCDGLARAETAARAKNGDLTSLGVDAWGVDYGLIDVRGKLLEDPVTYRDERTMGIVARMCARVPREQIFDSTGIQILPFNTLFQLAAQVEEGLPRGADRLLMMPDLCHHALCGSVVGEITNASTTQLLNHRTADWDNALFARLELPRSLMPILRPAGETLGSLLPSLAEAIGVSRIAVVQPATHDTASAVAGTPLQPGWAYISSGTWSLVGVELDAPLVSDRALAANFTNERGVEGTIRFLKNVMGLWILESCRREWQESGTLHDLPTLVSRAAALREPAGVVYPDAPRFFNPPHMVQELRAALTETGQPAPDDPVALTRIVLDSLALRYASVVSTIESLTGQAIPGIHIVGGGALNDYLNQATASATSRPVLAGPTEATAIGNLMVQAVASGAIGSIAAARRAVGAALPPRRYEPRPSDTGEAAARLYRDIEAAAAMVGVE